MERRGCGEDALALLGDITSEVAKEEAADERHHLSNGRLFSHGLLRALRLQFVAAVGTSPLRLLFL